MAIQQHYATHTHHPGPSVILMRVAWVRFIDLYRTQSSACTGQYCLALRCAMLCCAVLFSSGPDSEQQCSITLIDKVHHITIRTYSAHSVCEVPFISLRSYITPTHSSHSLPFSSPLSLTSWSLHFSFLFLLFPSPFPSLLSFSLLTFSRPFSQVCLTRP